MPTDRQIDNYNKAVERAQKKANKLLDELASMYVVELRQWFNAISKELTWGFYKSYTPNRYVRHNYSLRKIPHMNIDKKEGTFEIEFKSDKISGYHRVTSNKGRKSNPEGGRDYLYTITFLRGWHGGAYSGPPDANGREFPGTPGKDTYWRKPHPDYSYWFDFPAARYQVGVSNDPIITGDETAEFEGDADDTEYSIRDEILRRFNATKQNVENNLKRYFKSKMEIILGEVAEARTKYKIE